MKKTGTKRKEPLFFSLFLCWLKCCLYKTVVVGLLSLLMRVYDHLWDKNPCKNTKFFFSSFSALCIHHHHHLKNVFVLFWCWLCCWSHIFSFFSVFCFFCFWLFSAFDKKCHKRTRFVIIPACKERIAAKTTATAPTPLPAAASFKTKGPCYP